MCAQVQIHIKAGAAGLTLGKAWGLNAGGLEAWRAGWLRGGAGAGPGWLIENALKAATFQTQKKSQNKQKKTKTKNRKKGETEAKKKAHDFVFLVLFCGMNCVFLCFFL